MRRPHYIALGVVILLTLGLFKLPSRAARNLKLAISGMFLPLFGLAGSTEELADKTSYALLPRRELVRQIEQLEKTNQLWQIHFRQAQEWKRENDRLREQFGVSSYVVSSSQMEDLAPVAARLVGRRSAVTKQRTTRLPTLQRG